MPNQSQQHLPEPALSVDPSLPELGEKYIESSNRLREIVTDLRPMLLALGRRVLAANERREFTSIISDDVSGRFVARYLHDVLKPIKDVPILCAWSGVQVNGQKVGGNLERLSARHDEIGSHPLIATEAIHNGGTSAIFLRWLKGLSSDLGTQPIVPSIATLAVSQSRALSGKETVKRLGSMGAAEVIFGAYLAPELQQSFFNQPMLSGMVKLPGSQTSGLRAWASDPDINLGKVGRQRLINLGRSLIRDIAIEARESS